MGNISRWWIDPCCRSEQVTVIAPWVHVGFMICVEMGLEGYDRFSCCNPVLPKKHADFALDLSFF